MQLISIQFKVLFCIIDSNPSSLPPLRAGDVEGRGRLLRGELPSIAGVGAGGAAIRAGRGKQRETEAEGGGGGSEVLLIENGAKFAVDIIQVNLTYCPEAASIVLVHVIHPLWSTHWLHPLRVRRQVSSWTKGTTGRSWGGWCPGGQGCSTSLPTLVCVCGGRVGGSQGKADDGAMALIPAEYRPQVEGRTAPSSLPHHKLSHRRFLSLCGAGGGGTRDDGRHCRPGGGGGGAQLGFE